MFRVLFISGADGGTRRYRCLQPQEQLEMRGIATGFRVADDIRLFQDVLSYDVFIFHRVPYSPLIRDTLQIVRQRRRIAIFETDDLIFEPSLVRYDGYYRNLPSDKVRPYVRNVRACLQTLKRCDYALTTTGYLAHALRRRSNQVLISRNALSAEFVRLAEERCYRVPRANGRVVIGYVSGSSSHNQDFEAVSEALWHILTRHPHVDLRIVGPLALSERFASFRERIHQIPLVPWQAIPDELQTIDINIAPLEIDNPFCQAKSEVKYFEAGILGVPTVASRTEAFEYAIRHGETGLLAGNTREWIQGLELLIADTERRCAMGQAARRDALQNYTPEVRSQQFAETLRAVVTRQRPPAGSPFVDSQIERRRVALLAHHLNRKGNATLLSYHQREAARTGVGALYVPSPDNTAESARSDFEDSLQNAIQAVRRARRTPRAQIAAHVKHLAKRMTRRTYRAKVDGETYQLLGELTGGETYGQVIQATKSNLCGVDVLFATFDRLNTPDVIFRLKESPHAEVDLVVRVVSASALQDNRFFTFVIDPLPDSAGRSYYIRLESPDAVRGDAAGLWVYANDVQEGTYYENARPITGRLALTPRYTCR